MKGHTGVPTPAAALGLRSAALTGVDQNTHIHSVLRSVPLARG